MFRLLFSTRHLQIIAVGALGILVLSACSGGPISLPTLSSGAATGNAPAVAQVPTSTPIPTAPAVARPTYLVQRGDVQDILDVTGRWQPRDQLTLSFPIAGQVRNVNIQRGQTVKAGAILADLQITNLENQLASAQVNLNTAIQTLNQTSSVLQNVQNAQITLANAQIRLNQTVDNSPWTQVANAANSVKSAQAALDDAQRALDDALSHPELPASNVDQARTGLRNAQSNLLQAQNNYYSAAQSFNSHKYDVQTAQNSVVQGQLGLQNAQTNTSVDPQKLAAVQNDQLTVDNIQQQIDQSTIKSPIDAEVLDVTIKPGDSVKAFDIVITIGKPEPLEVVANVAFADASQLSPGLTVGIAQPLNHPEQAVQCIVRRVPLSAKDADQTTRVAATLNLPSETLVEVKLPKSISHNVLWLPPVAIRTFQNRTFVVVDTSDGPRSVDVTLGLQTTDRVEIKEGLKEGDIVEGP
jgi:multidrug efflux pump subunit AcrA (membrane-fusion protein)